MVLKQMLGLSIEVRYRHSSFERMEFSFLQTLKFKNLNVGYFIFDISLN